MLPAMAWTRRFGKVLVFTASILLFALDHERLRYGLVVEEIIAEAQ